MVAAIQLLHLPADPLGQICAERFPWFTAVGIPVDYHLAVDGLNLWLVLLTAFLVPLTLLGTWNSHRQARRHRLALSSCWRPACWAPSWPRTCSCSTCSGS